MKEQCKKIVCEKSKNQQIGIQNISCCKGKLFKMYQQLNLGQKIKSQFQSFFWVNPFQLFIKFFTFFSWFSTRHQFVSIYLLLLFQFIYMGTFLHIVISDPGVIQKINYTFQIEEFLTQIPKNQHINSHLKVSYLIQNKNMCSSIILCPTCNIYPPQRSNHCRVCGFCVQNYDHHSQFLGTCIAKKNYKTYFLLMFSFLFSYLVMGIMCIVMLSSDSNNFTNNSKIIPNAKKYPFSIVLLIIACPLLIFITYKISLHFYLLAKNLTLYQYEKQKWSNRNINPYSSNSCCQNIVSFVQSNISYRQLKLKYKKFVTHSKSSSESQRKQKSVSSQNMGNINVHVEQSLYNINQHLPRQLKEIPKLNQINRQIINKFPQNQNE